MKELFENVYKPLLKEVQIKDKIIENQSQRAKESKEQLSILSSIVRLPRMCTEFHKALRNKTSQEIQKATEARSIDNLSRLMKGQKVAEFMENI